MNDCGYISKIGAYLDGELAPKERCFIEGHIRECPVCGRELERLRRLRAFLRAGSVPEIPAEVLRRAHAQSRALPARGLIRLAARLALAAAAVLLACLGWLWRGEARGLPQASPEPTWAAAAFPSEKDSEASPETRLAGWIADDLAVETGRD